MKIWLDATPAIHGERAVRRNTRNLLSALISRNRAEYGLFYLDWKGNTPGRFALHKDKSLEEKICRLPARLLVPLWRRLGKPSFENLVGKVDLFYATDLYFPPSDKGCTLSTIRGIAYLVHPRLLDPRHSRSLIGAFRYACRRSDYFLAVSETTRSELIEYSGISKERVFVVTHGVDPVFRPIPKTIAREAVKTKLRLNRPYLLFVGAVAIHKNIVGLIDAFSLVARREKDIDLVLAGPNENAALAAKEKCAKKHLENRVHFIGAIDQEGLVLTELYNASEMLVFPSFYEGWCAPPLEAMACGIPVVCSDIPAINEVAGNAAIFADPKNPEAIANSIRRVIYDSSLRERLVQNGSAHVVQHTWERSAERLEKIFEKILETK